METWQPTKIQTPAKNENMDVQVDEGGFHVPRHSAIKTSGGMNQHQSTPTTNVFHDLMEEEIIQLVEHKEGHEPKWVTYCAEI